MMTRDLQPPRRRPSARAAWLLAALALAALLQCHKHHDDHGAAPPPSPPPPSGPGGTISGTLRYTNKLYNSAQGFTGATDLLPVSHAEVEIVLTPNVSAGTGVTDDSGHFAIPIGNYGTWPAFVRVYARRTAATSGVASPEQIETVVMNNASARAVYTAASSAVSLDTSVDQTLDLDIPLGSSSPFNIFDVGALSFQFLHAVDASIVAPPLLTFYWTSGTSDGTYMDTSDNSIHLLGRSSDSDDFDDDIILHEVGHYVNFNFSRDDSPGGNHRLTDHVPITLSWSEGWAHFWSAAARRWANATTAPLGRYPEYAWQVDTYGPSDHNAWNLGIPSYASQAVGADNEVAVACVLWKIAAAPADDGALDLGNGEIWNVVRNRFHARYNPPTNEQFVSLEDFRDEWTATYAGYDIAPILAGRTIQYVVDAQEPNDTAAAATDLGAIPTDGTATTRSLTFFQSGSDLSGTNPVGDEDWFKFTAVAGKTYVIETKNLGDGADTELWLYDAMGVNEITHNDNRSSSDPSSIITYTASASAVYYIRVAPSPGIQPAPAATQVATYGACDLSITVVP